MPKKAKETEIPAKDETAIPLIQKRIAELEQQREQHALQAQQQDAAFAGAIQAMKAVLNELNGDEKEEEE